MGTRSVGFLSRMGRYFPFGLMTCSLILAVVVFLWAPCAAHPETRWCSVTGRAAEDRLVYPAIAKAARVQGVVIGRLQFMPGEKVTGVDWVSGPVLLKSYVEKQVEGWAVATAASGGDPCQTLLVAEFRIADDDGPVPPNPSPSVMWMRITGLPLTIDVVNSDPAPLPRFWWIRRFFHRSHRFAY